MSTELDLVEQFLENVGGPFWLVSIDKSGILRASPGQYGQKVKRAAGWAVRENGLDRNVYWHVNSARRGKTPKSSIASVKEVKFLHVDIDPTGDDQSPEALEAQRESMLKALEKYEKKQGKASIVVSSGGGIQAFWRLSTPLTVKDDEQAEWVGLHNRRIAQLLGQASGEKGDSCHNIDRLMRVPFLVNWPDEKKRAKGRKPMRATLLQSEPTTYSLGDFKPAEAQKALPGTTAVHRGVGRRQREISELDQWQVLDRARVVVVQGRYPEEPNDGDDSRSWWLFWCLCELIRHGVPDEVMLDLILDPTLGISGHVLKTSGSAEALTKRAIRQVENAKKQVSIETGGKMVVRVESDGTRKPKVQTKAPQYEFDRDDNGKIYESPKNVRIALANMGIRIWHNQLKETDMVQGMKNYPEALGRKHASGLWVELQDRFHFKVPKETIKDVLHSSASANSVHPIKNYLSSLEWDGVPRVKNWLHTYGGAVDSDYTRAIGAKTLVALVRRIKRPGVKFDTMLVLISAKQGTGKSSALRILARNDSWFTDNLNLAEKEQRIIEAITGHWVIECPELSGMNRSESNGLKALMSRSVDKGRRAYGEQVEEIPRQGVFIGTTNDKYFLRDKSGNRRFWPAEIGEFDLQALAQDADQIWAEAVQLEAQGYSIQLERGDWGLAEAEQEGHMQEDPVQDRLEIALAGLEGRVRIPDLREVLGLGVSTQHAQAIAHAMAELGWQKTRLRHKGERMSYYLKGSPDIYLELVRSQDHRQPPRLIQVDGTQTEALDVSSLVGF